MPRGKKSTAKGEIKLARRHKESGEVGPRKRGRPHPDFELGHLDAAGNFKLGDPRGRKRRGRGKGRRPVGRPAGSTGARKSARVLGEIESIVRREVEARLKAAKEAAISAFTRALSV